MLTKMFALMIKASSQGKSFFGFSLYPRDVNSLCVSFTTAPMLQDDFIWPQKDRRNTNALMLVKTGAIKALGGALSKLRDRLLIQWYGKYWIPTYFCCCKHLSIIKWKDARLYVLTVKYHRKMPCGIRQEHHKYSVLMVTTILLFLLWLSQK